MNFINQHIEQIGSLCLKHKVQELYAFGSVLDDQRFTTESDVDLIVKFNTNIPVEQYADLFFGLADDLEEVLNRKVDLMLQKHIENKFLRENIEESKRKIYEA